MNEPSGMRRSALSLGVVMLVVAGALFIIGAFVDAATVEVQGQSSSSSLWDQDWEGWASLILGIVLLLAAGWAMMWRRDLRAGGLVIVVAGIAATAFALLKILNIESEAVDELAAVTAAQQGVPVEAAKPAVQQLFDSGVASVSVSIGLWMVLIAGVITIVAGILLAMTRPSQPVVTREPMQTSMD